jgi:hypothetical protein
MKELLSADAVGKGMVTVVPNRTNTWMLYLIFPEQET